MKRFIAIVFLLTATTSALAQNSEGPLTYRQDARTEASDEEVRVARRAYRAECQLHQTLDYCECMTGGMAQALTPANLRTATALLAHDLTGAAVPSGLDADSVTAARAAAASFEPSCRRFRR
jgi:hypothetical protein